MLQKKLLFMPLSRVFSLQISEHRNIPAILPNYFGHLGKVKRLPPPPKYFCHVTELFQRAKGCAGKIPVYGGKNKSGQLAKKKPEYGRIKNSGQLLL